MRRSQARTTLCVLVALAAAFATGCGSGGGGGKSPVVVALDFTPNAVHTPVFEASLRGFDRRRGVRIQIRRPGSGPDSLELVAAGRADIGVLDIQDLGLARERGVDVVGIGTLVQRPLGAIVAQPDIARPRDLAGHRVGVSGLPSDPAFLGAILSADGGSVRSLHLITIGFSAVPSLIEHKVDAVPAFWNDEGLTLRRRGLPVRIFRVDSYGAPHYPEVVLVTSRRTLARKRAAVVGALEAIRDGADYELAHPAVAAADMARAASLDRGLVAAQLAALRPVLRPPLTLNRSVLHAWAAWDARFGILKRPLDVDAAFAFGLVR